MNSIFDNKKKYLIIIFFTVLNSLSLSLANEAKWPFPGDRFDWGGKDPGHYSTVLNIHEHNLFHIIFGLRMAIANKKLRAREPNFSISVGKTAGNTHRIAVKVCEMDTGDCLAVRFTNGSRDR